jgi:hypothetical protein
MLASLSCNLIAQDVQNNRNEKDSQQATQVLDQQETDSDEFSEMTLAELSTYHTAKVRAYSKRYRAAPTQEEKRKVAQTIPTVQTYRARLIELINEEPGSEAGLEVVEWWFRRGGRRQDGDVITRLVLRNYRELQSVEKYVPYCASYLSAEEAEKELKALRKVNQFAAVKAGATYQLHELFRKQAEKLDENSAEVLNAEIKTLRDQIYAEYSDASSMRGAKYVDLIEAVEFASRLDIGKPVPDIVGTDLDGVDFKLSDYDGQVRVVSFWGDWWRPLPVGVRVSQWPRRLGGIRFLEIVWQGNSRLECQTGVHHGQAAFQNSPGVNLRLRMVCRLRPVRL